MKGFRIFAQLHKVDAEKRLVYGRAAQEVVDKVGEVFDYALSKPNFVKWSKEISEDTSGKSLGNVRAMHGKIAAGVLKQINFNDTDKAIDVCAKVVDDNEWNKVLEGVYTGFSIGGSYVGEKKAEKMDGKDVMRYEADPSEISLVDRPCMPTAKFFDVVKHDAAGKQVHLMKVAFVEKDIDGQADIDDDVEDETSSHQNDPIQTGGIKGGNSDASQVDGAHATASVNNDVTESKKAKDESRQAVITKPSTEGHQSENAKAETTDDKGVKKGADVDVLVEGSAEEVTALGKLMADNKFNMAVVLKIVADAASFAKHDTAVLDTISLTTLGMKKWVEDSKDAIATLVKRDFIDQSRTQLADAGKALPDGSYPIVNKGDLENALKAIGKAKDPAAAKEHIIKRAKALGATDVLPKDWAVKAVSDDLQKMLDEGVMKGMYDVAQLVTVVQSLYGLCKNAWYERDSERDDSMVPDRLKECVGALVDVLKSMVDEESAELISSIDPMDKVDAVGLFARLAKAGARHGKDDMSRVQKVHDLSCDLGAGCGDMASAKGIGLAEEKAELGMDKATGNAFEKMVMSAVAKATAPLIEKVAAAEARVKQLEDQPAPTTVHLRAIGKAEDLGSGKDKDTKKEVAPVMKGGEVDASSTAIKKIHAQGGMSILGVGQ